MTTRIAVVTSSRADYSHLYWPLRELETHPSVDLKLIVLASHLSPEFGNTVREIEADGFPIAARLESLLSSDTDVGMAKSIGVGVLSLADTLGAMRPDLLLLIADRYEMLTPPQSHSPSASRSRISRVASSARERSTTPFATRSPK